MRFSVAGEPANTPQLAIILLDVGSMHTLVLSDLCENSGVV